jgi:hypothetical protein
MPVLVFPSYGVVLFPGEVVPIRLVSPAYVRPPEKRSMAE